MQAAIVDIIKKATIVAAAAMATATIVAADIIDTVGGTRCPCNYHTEPPSIASCLNSQESLENSL